MLILEKVILKFHQWQEDREVARIAERNRLIVEEDDLRKEIVHLKLDLRKLGEQKRLFENGPTEAWLDFYEREVQHLILRMDVRNGLRKKLGYQPCQPFETVCKSLSL